MRLSKNILALLAALVLLTGCASAETMDVPQQTEAQQSAAMTTSLTLQPADDKAEKQQNGVWLANVNAEEPELKLKWTCSVPAVSFRLQALDMDFKRIAEAEAYGTSGSIKLPKSVAGQQVMVQLRAYDVQGNYLTGTEISVQLNASGSSQNGGQQSGGQTGGDTPGGGNGGWGGQRPGGGFNWGSISSMFGSRGGSSSTTAIRPGYGLVSGHADGTGKLKAYNTVNILPDENAMTQLTLDGQTLPVQLTDGMPFTAQTEDSAITLTPVGDADSWQVDGQALTLLHRSGVDKVILQLNDTSIDMPTDYEPQGIVYTQLRVDGCVPGDFVWTVSTDGVTCQVNGQTYDLLDNRLQKKED